MCRCFDAVWDRLVQAHGVDWCGFAAAREAFSGLPRCGGGGGGSGPADQPVRALSIELWDRASGALASAEVGVLCGAAYTTLSLFADVARFPRCDRVRAQAATLWLHRCGVALFDVGTTAAYYAGLFGFRRTTRREFVAAWRRHRGGAPLRIADPATAGVTVRQLLEEHARRDSGGDGGSDGGGRGGGGSSGGGGGGVGGGGGPTRSAKSAILVTGLPPGCHDALALAVAAAFGEVVRCTPLQGGKAAVLFADAKAMQLALAAGTIDVLGQRAAVVAAPAGKHKHKLARTHKEEGGKHKRKRDAEEQA